MKESLITGCVRLSGRQLPIACRLNDSLRDIPPMYILCFIKQGCLEMRLNQRRYVCSGPAFLCLNPQQKFRLLSSKNLSADLIAFHPRFLNKSLTDEFIHQAAFQDFCDVHDMFKLYPFMRNDFRRSFVTGLSPDMAHRVQSLFRSVATELEEQPDWYWSCRSRSYFMDILSMVERLCHIRHDIRDRTPYDFEIPRGFDDVSHVLFSIWSQYHDPELSVAKLSALVSSDPSTIYRRFKKVTGTTVGEYLIAYRLYAASTKLQFTSLTVGEIAYLSGFSSESYFCRLFKSRRGLSPGEFRRQSVQERKRTFPPPDAAPPGDAASS